VPSGPDVVPQRVELRPIDMEHEYRVVREAYAGRFARARAADLLALCERSRPDVLVRDEFDFGAAIAAERLGIACVSVLVNASGGFVRAARLDEPGRRLRAEFGLPGELAGGPRGERGLPAESARSQPAGERLPAEPARDALGGDRLVLSPFPPSFRDPADPLPATARSFRPADVTLAAAIGGRPLVYVTLGTIFNTESGDLLARIVRGLRELAVDVVVTVGRTLDPAELGPQPANVRVERFIPQAELLPRSAAAVTHAGSGSVAGALAHGVPLVCVPLGADQPLNAARCVAVGAGLSLDAMTLSPDAARAAVDEILREPRYRRAAERLRDELAAQPPVADAAGWIERLP
jgi:UDP-glucoronosyl and UDP-glucosyl transferase